MQADIATTRDKAVYKVWKLATGICMESCNSDKYSYSYTYEYLEDGA